MSHSLQPVNAPANGKIFLLKLISKEHKNNQ